MTDPVSTTIKLDYLGVRASIVVNRHGDRDWRATMQRRWKEGKALGDPEPLQTLTHEGGPDGHKFPNRLTAVIAAIGTIIEEEDVRMPSPAQEP
jgi:hypothetical protein